LRVIVTSPFGNSAKNCDGITCHSLFNICKLATNFEKLAKSFKTTKQLQEKFQNLSLLVIEECYVLSPSFFMFINIALKVIFNSSENFANKSILLCGDMSQLLPVKSCSLWSDKSKLDQFSLEGQNIYRNEFKTVFFLNELTRQADCSKLSKILTNIRRKTVTEKDCELLTSRCLSKLGVKEIDKFDSALRIFCTNDEIRSYNLSRIVLVKRPIILIEPKVDPPGFIEIDQSLSFPLSLKSRVYLTRNLDVSGYLTNGSFGTVEGFLFDPLKPDETLPCIVFVKFDNVRALNINGLIPIPLIKENVNDSHTDTAYNLFYHALALGFSTSVHKSQGSTVDQLVTKLGNSEQFVSQAYVQLSRAKRLSDILLEDEEISMDRFNHPSFYYGWAELTNEYIRLGIYNAMFGIENETHSNTSFTGSPSQKKSRIN
jgi:ATP-dependent DNA helicase PIF1